MKIKNAPFPSPNKTREIFSLIARSLAVSLLICRRLHSFGGWGEGGFTCKPILFTSRGWWVPPPCCRRVCRTGFLSPSSLPLLLPSLFPLSPPPCSLPFCRIRGFTLSPPPPPPSSAPSPSPSFYKWVRSAFWIMACFASRYISRFLFSFMEIFIFSFSAREFTNKFSCLCTSQVERTKSRRMVIIMIMRMVMMKVRVKMWRW